MVNGSDAGVQYLSPGPCRPVPGHLVSIQTPPSISLAAGGPPLHAYWDSVHDVTTWFDRVVIWENVTFYELWSSYFEQLLKHFITMHHKVEHG